MTPLKPQELEAVRDDILNGRHGDYSDLTGALLATIDDLQRRLDICKAWATNVERVAAWRLYWLQKYAPGQPWTNAIIHEDGVVPPSPFELDGPHGDHGKERANGGKRPL